MNDKCLDIGTIQAFLDGEASPQLSFEITTHAAACDKCALFIAEAEEETAQVFAMLDRELNTLVPTQRLWSSISVALAEEKSHVSFWDKARGYVLAMFANPSIAVAASVLLVFGIFAGVWNMRSVGGPEQGAYVAVNSASPAVHQQAPEQVTIATTGSDPVIQPPTKGVLTVKETKYTADKVAKLATTVEFRPENRAPRAEPAMVRTAAAEEALPGEESYIRTIATLKQSVDSRKDLLMDPSSRIAFERDLAVVNDAIKKMKDVVRRNPRNQAAKQVLYSSYQNKIDLLNSVAEREELMASMQ